MKRIKVLSSDIANQIAAGEVIERPASVIKELVENSLDASATAITIETRGGGIEYIRVTDNGSGIMHEDAKTAFLPHATSKITTSQDLFRIDTLGFRGEALASIAAVSKTTLSTMTKDEEIGTKLTVSAGEFISCEQEAVVLGTTIEVEDLFFNVPARLKFLKSPRTEAMYISDLISRLILANPSVAIKLIQNGKTVYQSPGDGSIDNAVYAIYGKDILEHLRSVDYDDGYIKITGRVGTEQVAKNNRTYQSMFVNSRYIKSSKLSYALSRAYETKMMVGMFPFCVLYFTMSNTDMDVNVHPTKQEIRFTDEERVVRALITAVKSALLKPTVREFGINRDVVEKTPEIPSFKPNVSQTPEKVSLVAALKEKYGDDTENKETTKETKQENKASEIEKLREAWVTSKNQKESDFKVAEAVQRLDAVQKTAGVTANEPVVPTIEKTVIISSARKKTEEFNQIATEKTEQISFHDESYRIVGQLFDCYIIVEQGNSVYFIDQHAAHERKLYEKYMSKDIETMSQQLLIPISIRLTPLEYDTYMQNISEFQNLGFETEDFGNMNINIRSVPYMFGEAQTQKFFQEALSMLADRKKLSTAELKRTSLIQQACKHAIKQGERLSDKVIEELIRQVKEDGIPLTCPHGRPIMLKMTRLEFEKQFKRVL